MTPIDQVTEEVIQHMFSVNVTGLLLATKAALPLFPESGGSIINIGSIASVAGTPTMSVYNGTKGAVDSITLTLAKELGPKANSRQRRQPGHDRHRRVPLTLSDGDFGKAMAAQTPLQRLGQPEDIALAVALLASDDARWITGDLIQVSGGLR